jgi:hypothetical protein
MVSKISALPNDTPSIMARNRWAGPCFSVRPEITPRALASV